MSSLYLQNYFLSCGNIFPIEGKKEKAWLTFLPLICCIVFFINKTMAIFGFLKNNDNKETRKNVRIQRLHYQMRRVSMSNDVRPVDGGLSPHPAYQIAPGTTAWPKKLQHQKSFQKSQPQASEKNLLKTNSKKCFCDFCNEKISKLGKMG